MNNKTKEEIFKITDEEIDLDIEEILKDCIVPEIKEVEEFIHNNTTIFKNIKEGMF